MNPPRVLVVGQPFDRVTGGGITLNNLFEGWPRDRLASVAVSDADLSFDVCDRVYALGSDEIAWSWPLSLVRRTETQASRPDVTPPTTEAPASAGPCPGEASGLAKRAFRGAVDGLGLSDVLRTMHVSPALRSWVREFQPDLIYSQLSDLPIMTLVAELLDETGALFALHVMDDWPSTMYRGGLLAPLVRRRAERALDELMRRASTRMAIGTAMADAYARRFGLVFEAVQNPVDVAAWDAAAHAGVAGRSLREGSPVVVLYAGRLGRANAESVVDVAETVAAMARDGARIEMRVHTPSAGSSAAERMSRLVGVSVLPPVPHAEVPALFDSADVLLLPLDFDEESVRFARLSMPTKVPEYMAAGRPVLTYAPAGSATAAYARDGGWSTLVDRRDPALLRAALESLSADPERRAAMGGAGRRLALQRHDANVVRARFAEELERAADRTARSAPATS